MLQIYDRIHSRYCSQLPIVAMSVYVLVNKIVFPIKDFHSDDFFSIFIYDEITRQGVT